MALSLRCHSNKGLIVPADCSFSSNLLFSIQFNLLNGLGVPHLLATTWMFGCYNKNWYEWVKNGLYHREVTPARTTYMP